MANKNNFLEMLQATYSSSNENLINYSGGADNKFFDLSASSLKDKKFEVSCFVGKEEISGKFEFEFVLVSPAKDVDLKDMIGDTADFTICRAEPKTSGSKTIIKKKDRVFQGIFSEFGYSHNVYDHKVYKAVLVDPLWLLRQDKRSQIFIGKSLQEIIEEVFKQSNLKNYKFELSETYPEKEYVCQYNESNFSFVSRLMEREGIYYFYDNTVTPQTLILTDTSNTHQLVKGEESVEYDNGNGLVEGKEIAFSLLQKRNHKFNKYLINDYNYRTPDVTLETTKKIDSQKGKGIIHEHGDHFKTIAEGATIAKIRCEETLCSQVVYTASSSAPFLVSGFLFNLKNHPDKRLNQKYLVTSISHKGEQRTALTYDNEGVDYGYVNSFTAICSEIQFRPNRVTSKPQITGVMNAKVDGKLDGKYAEIDEMGRYKVILPFDLSGLKDGNASRFIRMGQPYSGSNYGHHFPLHKGCEVLLTFINGDPDRPIISSAVPNPNNSSPVTSGNQTQSVIRTAAGNEMVIEDLDSKEQILISCPHKKSKLSLGDARDDGNIYMYTDGSYRRDIQVNDKTTVEQNRVKVVSKNETLKIGGNRLQEVNNDEKLYVKKNRKENIDGNFVQKIGENKSVTVGKTLKYEAHEKIIFQTGHSQMIMNSNGRIDLVANNINISSRENVSVKAVSNLLFKGKKATKN